MTPIKKLRKKYKVLHRLLAFVAIAALSWSVWKAMDLFFAPYSKIIGIVVASGAALLFLYLDDFHLKELE